MPGLSQPVGYYFVDNFDAADLHPAMMSADRVFTVKDDECVACNLCIDVFPVENCITMKELPKGAVDLRTGRKVGEYANWTTHPNNPGATAAE